MIVLLCYILNGIYVSLIELILQIYFGLSNVLLSQLLQRTLYIPDYSSYYTLLVGLPSNYFENDVVQKAVVMFASLKKLFLECDE